MTMSAVWCAILNRVCDFSQRQICWKCQSYHKPSGKFSSIVRYSALKTRPMNDASQSIQYMKLERDICGVDECEWTQSAQYATHVCSPFPLERFPWLRFFAEQRRSDSFWEIQKQKRCFVCKLMRWLWWFTTDQTPLIARCFTHLPSGCTFYLCRWMRQKIALKRLRISWFMRMEVFCGKRDERFLDGQKVNKNNENWHIFQSF